MITEQIKEVLPDGVGIVDDNGDIRPFTDITDLDVDIESLLQEVPDPYAEVDETDNQSPVDELLELAKNLPECATKIQEIIKLLSEAQRLRILIGYNGRNPKLQKFKHPAAQRKVTCAHSNYTNKARALFYEIYGTDASEVTRGRNGELSEEERKFRLFRESIVGRENAKRREAVRKVLGTCALAQES